ncbi:MAG: hypothetical protein V9G24_12770 [Rhodoblastus sp.]
MQHAHLAFDEIDRRVCVVIADRQVVVEQLEAAWIEQELRARLVFRRQRVLAGQTYGGADERGGDEQPGTRADEIEETGERRPPRAARAAPRPV